MALHNEQNDNLFEGDDSLDSGLGTQDSDNFFEELDKQVNSVVLEKEAGEPVQRNIATAENSPREERMQEQQERGHDYEKRYADSSREAKKLKGRLNQLEPYAPILDDMREDPNLISHIKGYYEGGGSTPGNLKEQLGLGEEFVFDYDEAIDDPSSDSSKLLNATIDGVVQKRLGEFASQSKEDNQRVTAEQSFRSKHNMSDDDFKEVVDFAQSRPLTYDDVYFLMNRGKKEDKIAQNTKGEMMQQMKKVREKPSSAAATGSGDSGSERSSDDVVFETLLGFDSELEKAFSIH
jgi:hypothetical protein